MSLSNGNVHSLGIKAGIGLFVMAQEWDVNQPQSMVFIGLTILSGLMVVATVLVLYHRVYRVVKRDELISCI